MSAEESQGGGKGYIEYRARIPQKMYVKLLLLKVVYRNRYHVKSVNDVILMAVSEFLERHEKDLPPSADS